MNQQIHPGTDSVSLYMKREDLLHPTISGNKMRKLKYNLEQARLENKRTLVTFGGAYSNHISAVAAAGKEFGFRTIGVIRGDELAAMVSLNPTLEFASKSGMHLEFINRGAYAAKDLSQLQILKNIGLDDCYVLPEGGSNRLAVRGCEEVLVPADNRFDYICCAVGTGATMAGIINSSAQHQRVLGFPALKGEGFEKGINLYTDKTNWQLISDYHFGGYAKISPELVDFMNDFKQTAGIVLDPVYTSKMVFGVMDMIKKGYFARGSRILMIHTGGLQGIEGMNEKLKNKHLPLIDY